MKTRSIKRRLNRKVASKTRELLHRATQAPQRSQASYDFLPNRLLNTDDELDRVLRKRGGLFYFNQEHFVLTMNLYWEIKQCFDGLTSYVLKELYDSRPRPLQWALISSAGTNAFAYASHENAEPAFDFIGINFGTIQSMQFHFARILAHPNSFEEIGDPSLEVVVPHLSALRTDVMSLTEQLIVPRCPTRRHYAFILTMMTLQFFYFHEAEHLRHGHVDLMRRSLSSGLWLEREDPGAMFCDPLLRQTLEWDADQGGVDNLARMSIRLASVLHEKTKDLPEFERKAYQLAYGNPRNLIRSLAFSLYMSFRLFDLTGWTLTHQLNLSHPRSDLRMFYMIDMLKIYMRRSMKNFNEDEFHRIANSAVEEAERACSAIQGVELNASGLEAVLSRAGELGEYIRALNDKWAEARPALDGLKRGGVLPP